MVRSSKLYLWVVAPLRSVFIVGSFGLLLFGCSQKTNGARPGEEREGVREDGGMRVSNIEAERSELHAIFSELKQSGTSEQERHVLKTLCTWIGKARRAAPHGYKVRLRLATDRDEVLGLRWIEQVAHLKEPVTVVIECPFLPPRTPWTLHTVIDPGNLELLIDVLLDE